MSARADIKRKRWKATARAAMAVLAAYSQFGSVSAQTVADESLGAAFYACAGQPVSIEKRLDAMNAANWVIADDVPAVRDLFALTFASGVQHHWVQYETKFKESALAGRSESIPVSWLAPTVPKDGPVGLITAGQPVNVEAVVKFADEGHALGALYFSIGAPSALLRMTLYPVEGLAQGYLLICDLYLAQPITEALIETLLPADVKPADLRKERISLNHVTYHISYNTTSGYAGKLAYVDATSLDQLAAYRARFGSKTLLSTILTFESRNVRLKNQM